MAKPNEGELFVVTGGANGIGRACAVEMGNRGSRVVILDIDSAGLEESAELVRRTGGAVDSYVLDVTDKAAVENAFARIRRDIGPVDVLLNNVGQSARGQASEFWCADLETCDRVVEISLKTQLYCTRQVVPEMRQRRSGTIINVSSESALAGDRGIVDYCAAKAGVLGFTRSLARELIDFNVTVNAVCPGATRSGGMAQAKREIQDSIMAAIPWGDMNEPENIALTVAFIAHPRSRMITGQMFLVNGGRVFH